MRERTRTHQKGTKIGSSTFNINTCQLNMLCNFFDKKKYFYFLNKYRTRMANSALKFRIIIWINAMSLCNYNNNLINFGQLYSNSCYTTFNIATLGMCIACEFHQLWTMRPCIYHIFRHLTKWLIGGRTGHTGTVV